MVKNNIRAAAADAIKRLQTIHDRIIASEADNPVSQPGKTRMKLGNRKEEAGGCQKPGLQKETPNNECFPIN